MEPVSSELLSFNFFPMEIIFAQADNLRLSFNILPSHVSPRLKSFHVFDSTFFFPTHVHQCRRVWTHLEVFLDVTKIKVYAIAMRCSPPLLDLSPLDKNTKKSF